MPKITDPAGIIKLRGSLNQLATHGSPGPKITVTKQDEWTKFKFAEFNALDIAFNKSGNEISIILSRDPDLITLRIGSDNTLQLFSNTLRLDEAVYKDFLSFNELSSLLSDLANYDDVKGSLELLNRDLPKIASDLLQNINPTAKSSSSFSAAAAANPAAAPSQFSEEEELSDKIVYNKTLQTLHSFLKAKSQNKEVVPEGAGYYKIGGKDSIHFTTDTRRNFYFNFSDGTCFSILSDGHWNLYNPKSHHSNKKLQAYLEDLINVNSEDGSEIFDIIHNKINGKSLEQCLREFDQKQTQPPSAAAAASSFSPIPLDQSPNFFQFGTLNTQPSLYSLEHQDEELMFSPELGNQLYTKLEKLPDKKLTHLQSSLQISKDSNISSPKVLELKISIDGATTFTLHLNTTRYVCFPHSTDPNDLEFSQKFFLKRKQDVLQFLKNNQSNDPTEFLTFITEQLTPLLTEFKTSQEAENSTFFSSSPSAAAAASSAPAPSGTQTPNPEGTRSSASSFTATSSSSASSPDTASSSASATATSSAPSASAAASSAPAPSGTSTSNPKDARSDAPPSASKPFVPANPALTTPSSPTTSSPAAASSAPQGTSASSASSTPPASSSPAAAASSLKPSVTPTHTPPQSPATSSPKSAAAAKPPEASSPPSPPLATARTSSSSAPFSPSSSQKSGEASPKPKTAGSPSSPNPAAPPASPAKGATQPISRSSAAVLQPASPPPSGRSNTPPATPNSTRANPPTPTFTLPSPSTQGQKTPTAARSAASSSPRTATPAATSFNWQQPNRPMTTTAPSDSRKTTTSKQPQEPLILYDVNFTNIGPKKLTSSSQKYPSTPAASSRTDDRNDRTFSRDRSAAARGSSRTEEPTLRTTTAPSSRATNSSLDPNPKQQGGALEGSKEDIDKAIGYILKFADNNDHLLSRRDSSFHSQIDPLFHPKRAYYSAFNQYEKDGTTQNKLKLRDATLNLLQHGKAAIEQELYDLSGIAKKRRLENEEHKELKDLKEQIKFLNKSSLSDWLRNEIRGLKQQIATKEEEEKTSRQDREDISKQATDQLSKRVVYNLENRSSKKLVEERPGLLSKLGKAVKFCTGAVVAGVGAVTYGAARICNTVGNIFPPAQWITSPLCLLANGVCAKGADMIGETIGRPNLGDGVRQLERKRLEVREPLPTDNLFTKWNKGCHKYFEVVGAEAGAYTAGLVSSGLNLLSTPFNAVGDVCFNATNLCEEHIKESAKERTFPSLFALGGWLVTAAIGTPFRAVGKVLRGTADVLSEPAKLKLLNTPYSSERPDDPVIVDELRKDNCVESGLQTAIFGGQYLADRARSALAPNLTMQAVEAVQVQGKRNVLNKSGSNNRAISQDDAKLAAFSAMGRGR